MATIAAGVGVRWESAVTEYRIGDLAQVSGVTSRNIRAYRERGLLDPPRRQGRIAWYDERHLTQLELINQLLAKGFTSAHIATFLDGIRQGHNLAEVLGLQHETIGAWRRAGACTVTDDDVTVDALNTVAQRLVRHDLGRVVNGRVVLTDPAIAKMIAGAENPGHCLQVVAEVLESTREAISELAGHVAAALPTGSGRGFDSGRLEAALHDQVVRGLSDYAAQLVAGRREGVSGAS
jgi:DNA-binding transcriptional MerR regulator